MIIYIEKFAIHRDAEYKFNNGQIVLIRGESGIGKTSILRAIRQCLYGGTSGESSVTIQYGEWRIKRTMPPACVTVTSNKDKDLLLTGTLAQAKIDSVFGTESLFDLCCHLKAGSYGLPPMPLFDSDPATRLRALTTLAFSDEQDPQCIVEKIREELKTVKRNAKTLSAAYKAAKKEYEVREVCYDIGDDNEEFLTQRLQDVRQCVATKMQKETQYTMLVKRKDDLALLHAKHQLAVNKANVALIQCESLPPSVSDANLLERQAAKTKCHADITICEKQLLRLVETQTQYNKQRAIHDAAAPILLSLKESGIEENELPTHFSRKEVNEIYNTWRIIHAEKDVCATLEIQYDVSSIRAEILRYENIVNYLEMREAYLIHKEAKDDYAKLPQPDIYVLETELAATKAGTKLLTCPCCTTILCLENGALRQSTIALKTQQDVAKVETLLHHARRAVEEKNKAQHLVKSTATPQVLKFKVDDDLEPYALEKSTLVIANNAISALRGLRTPSIPRYSDEQSQLLSQLFSIGWSSNIAVVNIMEDIDTQIVVLKEKINAYRESIMNLDEELSRLYNNKLLYEGKKRERDLCESRLQETQRVCDVSGAELLILTDTVEILRKECESIAESNTTIEDLSQRLNNVIAHTQQQQHLRRVEILKSEAELASEDVLLVASILYDAVDEHFQRLKHVVDAINIHLAFLTTELFNYAMSVQLSLFAVSGKVPKHAIAMQIIRRCELVPRFESEILSEGEKQRIVLAIMLALGMYVGWTKVPLLLLDEPMPRLDDTQRDLALNLLRRTNHNRTIVITEHHTIDDEYDHVISLGNNSF